MTTITDEYMREMVPKARSYSLVILTEGPGFRQPGVEKIIWEHGRRNHQMRLDGILSIVCPVSDGTTLHGIGLFNAGLEETRQLMDQDPGVLAGVFRYELHACRGFPGDCLPG